MYCRKCGSELKDDALFCSHCAEPVITQQQPTWQAQQPAWQPPQPLNVDNGSWGWFVLGLFVPVVGLILYLVWKNEKPLSAKRAGLGALVGGIATVVLTILEFVIFFFLGIMEGFAPSYYDYEFYARLLPFLFK